ncbi:DUF1837 domain-containing protein [Amycolatopsis orientalis]|uniref:HamA C-terminal domain-containing protein n=1 Tax=Amycolatopsis orientalis TaxID=31958 RepID=UPI0009F6A185|nr:DUF1837 domain-containing protein [Amycolatopsis orientalis]
MTDIPAEISGESLRQNGVTAWLADSVDRAARVQPDGVGNFLCTVGDPILLDGTKATVRTHFVVKDANGYPRVKALSEKLATLAIDYCIPRSRLEEANLYYEQTRSAEKFSQLHKEAVNLFTSLEKSGEGGELLLYFLLEAILKLPQILCKMPLKTSRQMHVHGTDGLHAKVLPGGNIALYWGESKMHATVSSAVDDCFKSIAPFLVGEMSDVRTRDLLLIRDHLDMGAQEVTDALVRYFISDNPEAGKIEFRGACLVGFDMDNYPTPHDADGISIRKEIATAMQKWSKRILKRVTEHELLSFEIEIFCIPVPSVDEFRANVRSSLGLK